MNLPLANRTIVITRSRSQAPAFRRLLEKTGARVLEIPTIEIHPRPSPLLDKAIQELNHYDWIIFTSAHGVEIFMERALQLHRLPIVSTVPSQPKICSIGPATARKVEQYGCQVTLLPKIYQAEGILEAFLEFNSGKLHGLRILIPRASQAREILPETLSKEKCEVDLIPVYDTVIPKEDRLRLTELLREDSPDLITFTSSSTVRHFVTLANNRTDITSHRYAAIGPITASTARDYGLDIVVQSEKSSIPDFVDAIERYFEGLVD